MPLLILFNMVLLYVVRPLRPLLRKVPRPRLRTTKRGVDRTSARKVNPAFAREDKPTFTHVVKPTTDAVCEVIRPILIIVALCLFGLSVFVKIHERDFDEQSLTAAGALEHSLKAECGEQCDHPACGVCNMGERYATARPSPPTKLAAYQYCCPLLRP